MEKIQAALKAEIRRLLADRNAILLAHNYQRDEVQEIADITGDSLGLSQEAAKTKADVIVFCGVHFMAESAAILSPEKTVLLPREDAGCPMADMITGPDLAAYREGHPDAVVVTYVNSSAEVKALSDVCCTSGNAVNVVKSIPAGREIFMVPDRNLAQWVAKVSGRSLTWWDGYCPTHERLTVDATMKAKEAHPDALLVVHPECPPEVVEMADAVLSTAGMYGYCRRSPAKEFIVGTEMGILYRLRKENPGKRFHIASR
ncbi:MAG: quinolinate synthase, partial [Deltaproteobacteria bacterium]|nr:quinolinate synthase [Deltaproteobacteria bacterium]